jgi:hypothetical protein
MRAKAFETTCRPSVARPHGYFEMFFRFYVRVSVCLFVCLLVGWLVGLFVCMYVCMYVRLCCVVLCYVVGKLCVRRHSFQTETPGDPSLKQPSSVFQPQGRPHQNNTNFPKTISNPNPLPSTYQRNFPTERCDYRSNSHSVKHHRTDPPDQ